MMRILKNKVLWLILYALVMTGGFLYLLFPSQLVLQQLEASAEGSGVVLKAASLHPSLPWGIKLRDLTVRTLQAPADVFFQGKLLDLQVNPFNIFREYKTIYFQGKAYSGNFNGRVRLQSQGQTKLPVDGEIKFQDIDLSRCSQAVFPLIKGLTGQVRGAAFYTRDDAASRNSSGKLSLYLSRGTYPLTEPFLGMNRLEFDRGEIQAQLKNGSVTVEKFEIYGAQVHYFFNGNIQLENNINESRLNLTGVMELAGKNKIKIKFTVGGTLVSPSFLYI